MESSFIEEKDFFFLKMVNSVQINILEWITSLKDNEFNETEAVVLSREQWKNKYDC